MAAEFNTPPRWGDGPQPEAAATRLNALFANEPQVRTMACIPVLKLLV